MISRQPVDKLSLLMYAETTWNCVSQRQLAVDVSHTFAACPHVCEARRLYCMAVKSSQANWRWVNRISLIAGKSFHGREWVIVFCCGCDCWMGWWIVWEINTGGRYDFVALSMLLVVFCSLLVNVERVTCAAFYLSSQDGRNWTVWRNFVRRKWCWLVVWWWRQSKRWGEVGWVDSGRGEGSTKNRSLCLSDWTSRLTLGLIAAKSFHSKSAAWQHICYLLWWPNLAQA